MTTKESSMNAIVPFTFEGASVRVIDIGGEAHFVLADVCRVLEIGDPHVAARQLDDDEKTIVDMSMHISNILGHKINDLGVGAGNNRAIIISEHGLYSLVLTSRKEDARRRVTDWRATRAYSEWLYVRDRYLGPAALAAAVTGITIIALLALGFACGWI
jgi:prophage antirepressor-like protein